MLNAVDVSLMLMIHYQLLSEVIYKKFFSDFAAKLIIYCIEA